MYDINFFSVYKKRKSKNIGFKKFAIGFIFFFVVANLALVGYALWQFNLLETSIAEKEAFINNPDTQAKMTDAEAVNTKVNLTKQYKLLLESASAKLKMMDYLDTALLDKVRSLTPLATSFTFAEYNGTLVNLECLSSQITDPMDMYHAFLNDPTFASVTLSGINVTNEGNVVFSIICHLAGGDGQ